MNENGTYQGTSTCETSGPNLRNEVGQIEADRKALTLEEGSLAFWTARALEEVVDRTVVCDPWENSLISQSAHKNGVGPESFPRYRLTLLTVAGSGFRSRGGKRT